MCGGMSVFMGGAHFVCACCTCVFKPGASIGHVLQSFSAFFIEVGLSLNLKFAGFRGAELSGLS